MTKKQREEAIAFMYENGVEFVIAPYGVYLHSACELCYYNDEDGDCPKLAVGLMCRQLVRHYYKTFFRKIKES